jgi:hypothetical protein
MPNRYRERITARKTGNVLVVEFLGVLTAAAMRRVRAEVWSMAPGALATCLDYRRAVVAITDADMIQLAVTDKREVPAPRLAWVLPAGVDLAIWHRQALRLATLGRIRYPTDDFERAIAWSDSQAARAQRQEHQVRAQVRRSAPS